MKAFTSAAVFGLVPVPPMPDIDTCGDSDNRPVTVENVNCSQLERPQREVATERMATKDEIARIRRANSATRAPS
jgi:hypothetical protein